MKQEQPTGLLRVLTLKDAVGIGLGAIIGAAIFVVTGVAVDSAGTVRSGSGHHHLIIDDGDSLAAKIVVPKDSTHLHFGHAQAATELSLPPGKHKLTLQFADGAHRSLGSQLSATVTVNVKK